MAPPKTKDWEMLEPIWRAGVVSVRQMAVDYKEKTGQDITHSAIMKHFKRLGVERDLSWKVQAKAKAMVSRAMVTGKVSTITSETDAEIIEAESIGVAEIQLSHRTGIPKKRELVEKLFTELEEITDGKEIIETLTLALGQNDDDAMAKLVKKISSLPARIKGVADLIPAYKTLVELERQAFGIEKSVMDKGSAIARILSEIDGQTTGLPNE